MNEIFVKDISKSLRLIMFFMLVLGQITLSSGKDDFYESTLFKEKV